MDLEREVPAMVGMIEEDARVTWLLWQQGKSRRRSLLDLLISPKVAFCTVESLLSKVFNCKGLEQQPT